MTDETKSREEICAVGLSIFQRGLTFGSNGSISMRLSGGGWLMSPTNASLGALDPARLSRFEGRPIGGGRNKKISPRESQLNAIIDTRSPISRFRLVSKALRAFESRFFSAGLFPAHVGRRHWISLRKE